MLLMDREGDNALARLGVLLLEILPFAEGTDGRGDILATKEI